VTANCGDNEHVRIIPEAGLGVVAMVVVSMNDCDASPMVLCGASSSGSVADWIVLGFFWRQVITERLEARSMPRWIVMHTQVQ
jgi:hypothetical protein